MGRGGQWVLGLSFLFPWVLLTGPAFWACDTVPEEVSWPGDGPGKHQWSCLAQWLSHVQVTRFPERYKDLAFALRVPF